MERETEIKELTLLLLWLTSWNEKVKDIKICRSWKGYPFDILNELKKEGLISNSYKAKSVFLTEEGVEKAKKLKKKYLRNYSFI